MTMIWFEKDRIPEGSWPFLNATHAGLRDLETTLVDRLDLTEGTGSLLITGCMQAYRQAVMRRTLDLAQSVIVLWNAGLLTGSVVSARALLETISTYYSFLERTKQAAAEHNWTRIGKLVDAYSFSTMAGTNKRERSAEHPPRVGQAVVDFIKATQPDAVQFWEQICDVAHPNGKQMLSIAGDLRDCRYDGRTAVENGPVLFLAVFNCLYSCCWLIASDTDFEILLEQIRRGGDLPADHPLIVGRELIDGVVRQVAQGYGKMQVGPRKTKKERR